MTLKAADIMNPHVVVAHPDMTISEIGKIMNKFRIGGVPVVKGKKTVGILTERCIMNHVISKDKKPGRMKVKDVMVPFKKMVWAKPDDTVEEIARLINEKDKTRIPILDKGFELVGIITNKDVIENVPALTDLIVAQAQMNKAYDQINSSVSFGKCEKCGIASDLFFRDDKFLCGQCAGQDKAKKPRFRFFGLGKNEA